MRGDPGRSLVFLGNYLGGLTDLLPYDRLGRPAEGDLQYLLHARDRADVESILKLVRYLREILGIFVGDDHRFDTGPKRRQQLFLEAADGQNPAAERDLAGHGDLTLHRDSGHQRDDSGCHGDAGRGPVLRGCTLGNMHVNVALLEKRRLDAEIDGP